MRPWEKLLAEVGAGVAAGIFSAVEPRLSPADNGELFGQEMLKMHNGVFLGAKCGFWRSKPFSKFISGSTHRRPSESLCFFALRLGGHSETSFENHSMKHALPEARQILESALR